MCAIIGSFNKDKLKELHALNSYRGELSYSLCSFKPGNNEVKLGVLMSDQGKMPDTLIDQFPSLDGDFFISHTQAPTTESKNIHPAVYGNTMLWHNGIIKQKTFSEDTWDTAWMLEAITNYGWSTLSRIDGTFACIMFDGSYLYAFRNEISPLFYDIDLNFSSTKFEGSKSLPPNQVFCIDINTRMIDTVAYFETHENPYYIPE